MLRYFLLFVSIFFSTMLYGQRAGALDSTFGTNGISLVSFPAGNANGGGVRQSDGKLVVCGTTSSSIGAVRFTKDGRLDSTFGINGKSVVSLQANDIAYGSTVQSDDKIIIVGASSADWSDYNFCAVRLNADGSLDSTFGTNGKTILPYAEINEAHAVAVQPDGKILIAGFSYYRGGSVTIPLMTRLTSAGNFDASFGWVKYTSTGDLGYWVWIYSIALQSDGKIYIGGTTNSSGTPSTTFIVYRYNIDGSLDNTFAFYNTRYSYVENNTVSAIAYALAVQPDGKVIAAGFTHNDFYVCRFQTNGSIDASFGSSFGARVSLGTSNNDWISSCVIQADGKILVGGRADSDFGLARFNPNGTLDTTFGTGGKVMADLGGIDEIRSVFIDSQAGKIIALGSSGDKFSAARFHSYSKLESEPTVQSSSLTGSLLTQSTAKIRWTKGNGVSRLVIARADSAVNVAPSNGIAVAANAAYGSGTNLGSSNYVVYNGSDSVVTISGLIIRKTYYFAVYEYNGTGAEPSYLLTNPATGSITISPLPENDGSSYVMAFDGTNDYISQSSITQNNGPFTVEAWINCNGSNSPSAGILNRSNQSEASKRVWKINMSDTTVRMDFWNTFYQYKTVFGVTGVKDNRWHHIAGKYDGTNIYFYIDGNLQGQLAMDGIPLNNSITPLILGNDDCCSGRYFNGKIAELRLWKVARTQQEIRENMHKHINADDTRLIALFSFDSLGNATTYDSVSNTYASRVNFNNNSTSGYVKSNPPFGIYGTFVPSAATETSTGAAGATVSATISSSVDSVNTLGLYSFGSPTVFISDVQSIADKRSQIVWGVQKKGISEITADVVFDYSGTGISPAYAKLLNRSSAASSWTDVTSQSTNDAGHSKFIISGTSSSGEYSIATSNNDPLPVELNGLTAAVQSNNVTLHWQTATEINNAGFDIEKRTGKNGAWKKIGFQEGSGTSNSVKKYSYTEKNLSEGKYFYRLKQIDRDGKFSYSQEVEAVVTSAPKEFSLLQNYPNPFNPTTTIQYSLPANGNVTLTVYDLLGKEVTILINGIQPAGNYSVSFDASHLSSGMYFAKLQSGGKMRIMKMLLMK
ncbi:MAG: T9SS type A sorting domain-containing protein [Bacteroidetes bacterium]|nr:T9SS type A sorting domain-containing protein [Bacteroidota bacterium]